MKKLILILSIFALCLNSVEACSVTIAVTGNYCVYHGGATNATPSGGTSPYSYSWTGPSSYTSTSQNNSGLVNAGTYNVTVTDNVGCTATGSVTISIPGSFLSTTMTTIQNETCYGQSIGIIATNPTGGFTPYSYVWSPSGGTQQTASNLSSIQYTVTITDNTGCTKTNTQTPTHPTEILLNSPAHMNQVNLTCYQSGDGIINMNPTGGTGGYTYAWSSSSATTATVSNLAAGNYTVTVTDASSCTKTATATLTQPTQILPNLSQTNNTCFGTTNGIGRAAASGGSSPYTYVWSSGGATTATVSNLASGNYTVTVTDHISCTATGTLTILPPLLSVTISSQVNDSCHGQSNGALTVTGTGGTSGYTYSWAGGLGTNASISGLVAGNYTVTVTDAHSCTASSIITITQPATLSASIASQTNVTCYGGSNGAVTVSGTGGTSGYTYNWGPAYGPYASLTGLAAGNYTCTVTDAHSCSATVTVTITQPSLVTPTITASGSTTFYSGGMISLNAGAYSSYIWSTGATIDTILVFSSGTYYVTVTNSSGCTGTASDVISVDPSPFTKTYNYSNNHYYKPNSIIETYTSDFWMTGQTDTLGAAGSSIFLYHLNGKSSCDTLMTKTFSFTSKDNVAYSIQQTYDKDLLISGFGTTSGTTNKYGLYFKVDTTGSIVWQKTLAYTGRSVVFYASCITINDSGAAFAGYYKDTNNKVFDCLLKTDKNGDTMWFKTYAADSGTNISNIAYSLTQTTDAGYLLAGSCLGKDSLPKIFVNRTDSVGKPLWTYIAGDSGKSYLTTCIKELRTQSMVLVGTVKDAATNQSSFFIKLSHGGVDVEFEHFYANTVANTINPVDAGWYIITGKSINSNNTTDAWVLYADQQGDSLSSFFYGGSLNDASTNSIYVVDTNTFVLCGTYTPSGTNYYVPVIHYPIPMDNPPCPEYYDRAIRLTFTNGLAGDEHLLQYVFDWDNNNSCCAHETDNLLRWIQNNHITKLIIDGVIAHGTTGDCYDATSYINHDCLLYQNQYSAQLASFISNAKQNYGVLKVFATIAGDLQDRLYGTINFSLDDINQIVAYNESSYNNTPYSGIDGFWIDYEFWDGNYCAGCDTNNNLNGCGKPIVQNSYDYYHNDELFINYPHNPARHWTELGFKKFDSLIMMAQNAVVNVNAWYDTYHPTYTHMVKSEVVIIQNLDFNIMEGANYPYYLATTSGPNNFACNGSLTQGLLFAQWILDPSHNIGSITVDLTAQDVRNSTDCSTCGTLYCNDRPRDRYGCTRHTPDFFLKNDVDNSPNQLDCDNSLGLNPYYPNHFSIGSARQRCFDFLGTFSDGTIPICPYFSTENSTLNTENALSHYMMGGFCEGSGGNQTSDPIFAPNGLSYCASNPIYLRDIHTTFQSQFNNSWKESFVQTNPNPLGLYSDSYFSSYNFAYTQNQYQTTPVWGGFITIPNTINLGAREWFPFNSYPLVLVDGMNYYDYTGTAAHLSCYNSTYPTSPSPPLFWFHIPPGEAGGGGNNWVEGYCPLCMGAGDYFLPYPCLNPIPLDGIRLKNPNPKNPVTQNISLYAKIYPNPSDGNFNLDYKLPSGKGELIMTDIAGRVLYRMNITGITGTQKINVADFVNGVYYWHIISGNETPPNGKIILLK